MNKREFFSPCDQALYGRSQDGILELSLRVMREPDGYMGGNLGVFLSGWFRHLGYRAIESVKDQNTSSGSLSASDRCRAKLPKYERWLAEWKAANPPKTYDICRKCNGPRPNCWCR